MINRILIVIFASLFLAACGGGGGGGGGATANNAGSDSNTGGDDSSDQGSGDEQEEQAFTQEQSEYLPLIAGRGWDYQFPNPEEPGAFISVGLRASAYGGSDGLFVVPSGELDYGGAENASINQVFRSTKDSIEIIRVDIDGFELPFPNPLAPSTTVDVSIDSLDFGEASLVIIPGVEDQTVTSNLTVTIPLFGSRTFSLDSTLNVTNSDAVEQVEGWGNIPVKHVVAVLHVDDHAELTPSTSLPVELTIRETATFAPGVGPVARKIEFIQGAPSDDAIAEIDMTLIGLLDLPEPIIYTMGPGDPVLSSNAYINIDGTDLTTSDYRILNSEDFGSGESDWLDVEVTNSNFFNVIVSATSFTPDEATSRVIYLSESGSDVQIPVNVTLTTPDPD